MPVTFAAGGQTWQIAPNELGVEEDWDAAVDDAMAKGGGSTLVRGFRRIGLRPSPADVEPAVHAYDNAVKYKVSLLAEDVDRPHRDARLVRHGLSFELVGGQTGSKLDREAAAEPRVAALAESPRETVAAAGRGRSAEGDRRAAPPRARARDARRLGARSR